MNRQVLELDHNIGERACLALELAQACADAQLFACAVYLAAHPKGELVVLQEMAATLNVTDWTVARWIKTLADKGVLAYERMEEGHIRIAVKAPRSPAAPPKAATPPKAVAAPPAQPEPHSAMPNEAQAAGIAMAAALDRAAHRLKAAVDTYQVCEEMLARTKSAPAVKAALSGIVKNKSFDRLDLPKELLDADAWLLTKGKGYTDMGRFIVGWMRSAVKFVDRDRPKNINLAPTDKYDALAKRARGE